jgi:hypothetical protein
MGRAYVGFARKYPGLFALMYRSERLDAGRPALRDAIAEAQNALRAAASAHAPEKPFTALPLTAQSTALWGLVHGFAMLLIDGRLNFTSPPTPTGADRRVGADRPRCR